MFRARHDPPHTVWQDREIRFDINVAHLQPRKGEVIYDQMEDVEDTKGGSEELGTLLITNLRAIWTCKQRPRTNISIGMFCFTNMSVRDATSRIKGSALQMTIQTRFNNSRFEFIFTNTRAVPRIFQSIVDVYQLYDSSRLFRDLKLRGVVVKDKDLLLLSGESTYSMVKGCWNLSSEQGNLGTFFITNIRVVWFAELAEGFNVSIPYMQMKSVKVRDSKFGTVLVVETLPQSGDYVLGFKIDPQERLQEVHQEIRSLMDVFLTSPTFGVDYQPDINHQLNKLALDDSEQDVMIVSGQDHRDGLAMYYSEEGKSADRDPVFMPELGLACEQLREDVTLQQLWGVV